MAKILVIFGQNFENLMIFCQIFKVLCSKLRLKALNCNLKLSIVKFGPQISNFLKSHNLKMDEKFSVIVNQGPGSFSGVRISLAVAKGLEISKKVRLYGYKNDDLKLFNQVNIENLLKKNLIEKKLIKPIYLS